MSVLQKPNEFSWIRYIHQRIQRNKNFLGFISGATGSGKSWSSLSIAEMCDSEFCIERCVFSPKELMSLINGDKLKSGSCIVFEEVGVNMSSRNWQSVVNKMLNFLLQTFRHRNFILIMNSPYMDFVDAQCRRLFHAEFRTAGIDLKTNTCILKPYTLQYNGRLQKFFYKYLRVLRRGVHGSVPIKTWRVPKPSQELLIAYEEKKKQFTDSLNKEIQEELENVGQKKKKLTLRQTQVYDLLKQKKTIKEISVELNLCESTVYQVFDVIRSKGYKMKQVMDDKRAYYEEI